ncbi:MAG TPA: ATP-binding protein [Acidimicrobiales bacterium]|nr:ATP-binding protein [Acidimicrobiales bacterium]
MKVPGRTGAIIAAAFTAGATIFTIAVVSLVHSPLRGANEVIDFATLSVLVIGLWVRPLVMYRGSQSEAINLDEGFVLVAALLLPAGAAILVFAIATAIAQVVRRRPLMKSVFNWGQVVTSAGVAVAVTRLIAPPTPRLTGVELVAAAFGAAAYFVVNGVAIATVVASLGTSWWSAARDGLAIRVRLLGACIAVALMSSLAISAYRWSLPLAVLPLLILRQVLAGHFEARHDRERMLGLFEAAVEANRSLGEGEVANAVLEAARRLLRCPDARVSPIPPGPDELGAPMLVNGESCWLVVSGRSQTEPFDAADQALLETLGAVGAGALTNGENYRDSRFQRERLAAITSSLGEGVCALDRSGAITFANPAAARLLGWGDDAPRATPEFLRAPALAVMETRAILRSDDTDFRHDSGEVVPVAYTASAILDDDEVAGAVVVFRDISERREVEKAIREARDQAIEASQLKSRFLANMSHEIRTPMNGVLVMSRMMLDTDIDDIQRAYLQVIMDSGDNLMVIINDILDFSKIESGKFQLEAVDFDLPAAIASVANALSASAYDKGLELRWDLDPRLPVLVNGDPVRLRQIVTNLVGNAIKFTPSGSVTIAAHPTGANRVRVAVTDTGIGIEPAAQPTILDAFRQADSSTTRRYGGTGLGLAISNELVSMMGGTLAFSSVVDQGSSFWFEIPLADVADPVVPHRSSLALQPTS